MWQGIGCASQSDDGCGGVLHIDGQRVNKVGTRKGRLSINESDANVAKANVSAQHSERRRERVKRANSVEMDSSILALLPGLYIFTASPRSLMCIISLVKDTQETGEMQVSKQVGIVCSGNEPVSMKSCHTIQRKAQKTA